MNVLKDDELKKLQLAISSIDINGIDFVELVVAAIIQKRLEALAKDIPFEVGKMITDKASLLDIMVTIMDSLQGQAPFPELLSKI